MLVYESFAASRLRACRTTVPWSNDISGNFETGCQAVSGGSCGSALRGTSPRKVDAMRRGPGTRCGSLKTERSEEHTSELQSLMRISYAVFCLKKKRRENKRRPTARPQQ